MTLKYLFRPFCLVICIALLGPSACRTNQPGSPDIAGASPAKEGKEAEAMRQAGAAQQGAAAAAQMLPDTTMPSPEEMGQGEDGPPIWAAKQGKYNPENARKFNLRHTKLEVGFDWQQQHLNGTATLTLAPHFYAQKELLLDAKGFTVHQLALLGTPAKPENKPKGLPLEYAYDGRKLRIKLPRPYARGEELVVQVTYTAKPNDLKMKGSEAIEGDKGLYFINPYEKEPFKPRQLWTQGETEANSCWFPTIDAPNVKTTQEMYITVDKEFISLSNGKLVGSKDNANGTRTDHWRQDKPHAPYLFMMAVGKYAVVRDRWRDREVNYYVEKEYEPYARAIFGRTPEMMEYFSKLLDYPFPWDKYSQVVVRDFVSGAMENTSASVFMEQVQVDHRYLLDDNWDNIIAHELIHHWFGDLVTCESWANLPLNESFANYGEYLWQEHKYGRAEADYLWRDELESYLAESETKQEPMIRYRYLDKEDMFDSHSYAKGCLIMHMLRNYVGDEAFFASLQLYLKKYEYKKAEIHDLRLVFEEVTGEDLNWFFDQWFLSAGHPLLAVRDSLAGNELVLTVEQRQDTLYTPVYRLPVQVDVWVRGQRQRHQLDVTERAQVFRLPVAAPPDLVLFDAETQLLGVVEHPKTPERLMYQLRHSDKLLAKLAAAEALRERLAADAAVRQALFAALANDHWQVRQAAADAFADYAGADSVQVADKLKNLALNDEKSLVRASAVNALAGKVPPSFFLKTLNDSSYTVLANSMYAYANAGGEDPAAVFERFDGLDNLVVVKALAEYYAYAQVPDKLGWYLGKMARKSGYELSYLFNNFGAYLLEQPAKVRNQGIDYLANIARTNPNHNTRVNAYAALQLFEGIDDLKRAIREAEQDERVLHYYRLMKD
jgi:aminopeptidase N